MYSKVVRMTSTVSLCPLEAGEAIKLPTEKTVIGRGSLLQVHSGDGGSDVDVFELS